MILILAAARVTADEVLCLGMSVLRGTFISFDKATGRPFHPLITWLDCRGDKIVEDFNKSLVLKLIRAGSAVGHWLTRSNKLKQASKFKLANSYVIKTNIQRCFDDFDAIKSCLSTGYTTTESHYRTQSKAERSNENRPSGVCNDRYLASLQAEECSRV